MGHASDKEAGTGCTVVLCPPGSVGGIHLRGTATGTRQADSLSPMHFVDAVHAFCLSGGSAYGLGASCGVMSYLEERGVGLPVGNALVPIVPTAILYDLAFGDSKVRPDAAMGYDASLAASGDPAGQGSVGAGTGATVGKLHGIERATKSGIGSASLSRGRVVVGGLAAVNAWGDVVDPVGGRVVAGTRRSPEDLVFIDTFHSLVGGAQGTPFVGGEDAPENAASGGGQNTTLALVATNARLTCVQASQLAGMAFNGLSRAIRPVASLFDGDLVFAVSTGRERADMNLLGAMAEEVLIRSVLGAVRHADGFGILPSAGDMARRAES